MVKKQHVQAFIETDDGLRDLANILFAEICDLVEAKKNGHDVDGIYPIIEAKTEEFERAIMLRAINRAEDKLSEKKK
jgi:hypothetical protein